MKKIACLFCAQLLVVLSVLPLVQHPVAAATHGSSRSRGQTLSLIALLRDENFMRRVYWVAEHTDALREERGADSPLSTRPVFGQFQMLGGHGSSTGKFPLVLDDPPDELTCFQLEREFLKKLREYDKQLDPVKEGINSQMGVSGNRLDTAKFASTFVGTAGLANETNAAYGLTLPEMPPGAFVNWWIGAIGVLYFLVPILESWDKDTESIWAHDLLKSGLAKDPEQAFQMAEAIGDLRMHCFYDNPPNFQAMIADWYHGRELTQDARTCLAMDHDKHKEQRPHPGSDYRSPNKPMRPNDNHGDPRTSGSCKRYEYLIVESKDDQGNVVSTGVTLSCVEYW